MDPLTAPNEYSRLLEDAREPSKGDESIQTWAEVRDLFSNTLPIAVSFAQQNIVQALSALLAGTLGSFELEVVSYGFMFASCTGTMVAVGGSTALDTLCGQSILSITIRNDPTILGLYLQQCLLLLLTIFLTMVAPVWVFSGKLFMAIGQEPEFALATGKFMHAMLLAGFLQIFAECLKKFLQVQGESYAVGWIMTVTSAIGVCVSYLMICHSRLRIWGSPAAFTIYQLLNVLLLAGMIAYKPRIKESWRTSTKGFWKGSFSVLKYAITGILTVATEWWSFEILAVFAASLPPKYIGAQSIIMSSDLILTTACLGLGVAVSHRIGNLLGAGEGRLAKQAALAPYLLALLIGSTEALAIMVVRHKYGYLFTREDEVVETAARILPLMAGFQFLDLANGGAGGILRGAGKNHLSGVCNFFAYYGVGLTTAWWLCFRWDYGLFGLWAGIITGSFVLLLLQTGCILLIRWDTLAVEISTLGHEQHTE